MSDIDLLLSVPTLMDLVEQFPTFTNPLPFQRLYQMGGVDQVDGDRIIFEKLENDRRLAAIRDYESEAYVETEPNRVLIDQGLIHQAEKEIISPKRLFHRAGNGTFMRSNAPDVVRRAVQRITTRLIRTREFVAARILQDATVTLNAANTNFPAGANTAAHAMTIEGGLQTFAVAAAWDVDTTKIISGTTQLSDAQRTFEANGHSAWHLIVNREVVKTFVDNIEAQTWLTANGGMTIEQFKMALNAIGKQGQDGDPFTGSVFNGMGGIPSWPVWDHGYINRAGTFTRYLDDDNGIMLPQDLSDVLGFAEGNVFVPSTDVVIGDADQAADLFRIGKGIQLYAYRTLDDVGNIVVVGRDTFLPFVRNELGIQTLTGLTT